MWNCICASSKAFFKYCKQYVDMHKPTMMVVVETMCDLTKVNKALKLLCFDDFIAMENQIFSEGIVAS